MAEITVPNYAGITIGNLDFDEPAQVNRSAWTGKRKVTAQPGAALWFGQMSVIDIATETEEQPWRAFVAGLRGVQNWFRLYLPCQQHTGAMPTVDTGANAGYTLPLTGLTASTTILNAGQHMTVTLPSGHFRAVRLTANLVSNVSGKATASFAPALNEVPVSGAAVDTKTPFVPVSSTSSRISITQSDGISSFSLDVEEAR